MYGVVLSGNFGSGRCKEGRRNGIKSETVGRCEKNDKILAKRFSLHKEKYLQCGCGLELTAWFRLYGSGFLGDGRGCMLSCRSKGRIFFCLPFHWWPRSDIHLWSDNVGRIPCPAVAYGDSVGCWAVVYEGCVAGIPANFLIFFLQIAYYSAERKKAE